MTNTMNVTSTAKSKAAATVSLIARQAADGYVELIVDVSGGFVFRDKLKANGFQFVKNCTLGLGGDARLDREGNRKNAAVWRRIFVAVPPGASPARAITAVEHAIENLEDILSGILEGSRVKRAKSSALVLAEKWKNADGIQEIVAKLSALDTPWQPYDSETQVRRPQFAA